MMFARRAVGGFPGGLRCAPGIEDRQAGVGVLGFAAPLWMLRRWRGGWRIAAAVPAAWMAFVVLRIAFGVARDPTSHNLWPFEILTAGALNAGVIVLLHRVRQWAGWAP